MTTTDLLASPVIRRTFEEELLYGEATDTVAALLQSLGLTRTELADRLGVSKGRVSQILSGSENITLKTLAAMGWALGVRFDLRPTAMANRAGTPAQSDPPAPRWLDRLGRDRTPIVVHRQSQPRPTPSMGSALHHASTRQHVYQLKAAA